MRLMKYDIFTEKVNKVALDSHDLKQIILDCKIHTLQWAHYRLVNNTACEHCIKIIY